MPGSPLHAVHEEFGARFTEFGGWTMPVQYSGVLAEHEAVRSSVGVFDVSHLGRFRVAGAAAVAVVRQQLCNDITSVAPGRAQYTMALNDDGGVVDDIIVWWIGDAELWVMPNGTNFDAIVERFRGAAGTGTDIEEVRSSTVLLAVQGPEAPETVASVLGRAPGRFRVIDGFYEGYPFHAAGTGYTGERGAEIAVPSEGGAALLAALIEAGATVCGLGARDTLRLEMGYPLWGQDLDETTTPLEAGLGWAVAMDHDFVGRGALQRQHDAGISRRLDAFRTAGRAIPRHGYRLRSGRSSGTVTSGNFSPSLGYGIGMGYLSPPVEGAESIEVEIRDTWVAAERVRPPFLEQ